jgi:hypothetical protein
MTKESAHMWPPIPRYDTLAIRWHCLTRILPQKPKFKVGKRVYLHNNGSREGPYLVATATLTKCTLCLEDGEPVRDGEEIDWEYVEAA